LAVSRAPQQADEIQALHRAGIRAILTLSIQSITASVEITPELLLGLDIYVHHVPIPDNYPPTLDQANGLLRFLSEMRRQDRPVLIHCDTGVQRTGTVLQLYYIAQGLTYETASAQRDHQRSASGFSARVCATACASRVNSVPWKRHGSARNAAPAGPMTRLAR
jgi:hypothetical protein